MNSSLPITDVEATATTAGGSKAATGASVKRLSVARWQTVFGVVGVCLLALLWVVSARAWRHLMTERELSLARQALREFRPSDAVDWLTLLTARRPDFAEAEFVLACAYRRAARLDLVEPHLKRAAELGWDKAAIDRQFCLMYFQAGDFRRSAAELNDRLRESTSDDEAEEVYEALARGYMAAMLLRQANYVLDGWLRWRPKSVQARLLQAEAFDLAGNEERELEVYREAARCEPSNYAARHRLAHALLRANQIAEAAQFYEGCLRDRPGDPAVLVGLAECKQRLGQIADAKELLDLALAAHPKEHERASALALSGQIALEAKNYDEACRLLQDAVEADPSSVAAVYSLSQALARAGRADDAEQFQARWRRLHELEDRLHDLHVELLSEPGSAEIRAEIGEVLLEEGATKPGIKWLLTALIYDAGNVRVHRRLAEHYEREGQLELAARHRDAAKSDPVKDGPPRTPFLPTKPEKPRQVTQEPGQ